MNRQKGFSPIILILVLVLIAIGAVGAILLARNTGTSSPTQSPSAQVSEVKSASDLNSAASALDSSDLNQIDTELNQININ